MGLGQECAALPRSVPDAPKAKGMARDTPAETVTSRDR